MTRRPRLPRALPPTGWRGLTLQLFLFIVLPLTLLLLAIAFGSLTLHGQAMRRLVGERDERAARAAAAAIEEALAHRAAAVRSIALRASDAAAPAALLADYSFLLPDFDGGLALFDPEGRLRESSGPASDWSGRPVDRLLARAAGQGEAQFSAAFRDPASPAHGMRGLLVLVAARAPEGRSAVGAFTPASLAGSALSGDSNLASQSFAFLIDQAGQVLFQSGVTPQAFDLTQHPGVAEALRGERGMIYLPFDGSEHVVAYSPVEPLGWALVIEEPWEAVANPLLRRTQTAPLVLVPVVLFALVVLGFGIRQIVQPLSALTQKAQELSWGRYEAIEDPVGGISEIRRLQSELVHMTRKVRAAQQSLRGYVSAITAGQEEERKRLARELHDETIQSLIALNQRVQMARSTEGGADNAALAELQHMTGQIIEEVRRFIRALRPIYLEDLGLVPALESLARDTGEALGIPVDFNVTGAERRLKPEVEVALYRMAQEALNNVARHAQATRAWVRLAFAPEHVTLTLRDDGQGFALPESPADFAPQGHFGLLGLHERAELIGAQLELRSTPGGGTTVEVHLPATNR